MNKLRFSEEADNKRESLLSYIHQSSNLKSNNNNDAIINIGKI